MGYQFTLILSRTITDRENEILHEAGCDGMTVTTAPVPPNGEVTQLEFDTEGPSLEAAITVALEAAKTLPDLAVTDLIVPAQPDGTDSAADLENAVLEGTVVAG